jgi:hypothetical protein
MVESGRRKRRKENPEQGKKEEVGRCSEEAIPVIEVAQEWALLEPLIPPAKAGGHPRTTDMREVINAILYLDRTGAQWRALPHEFPPWSTVWSYFRTWPSDWHLAADAYGIARSRAGEAGT